MVWNIFHKIEINFNNNNKFYKIFKMYQENQVNQMKDSAARQSLEVQTLIVI